MEKSLHKKPDEQHNTGRSREICLNRGHHIGLVGYRMRGKMKAGYGMTGLLMTGNRSL